MRRHLARLVALSATAVLLLFGFVAVPSAVAGNPCFHDYVMPPVTTAATNQIKLADCAFGPTIAQVPTGATVTFFNGPHFTHLITGAAQAWGSPDVEVQPNAEISYTFDAPGIYPYACVLHPGMSGAIVVGDVSEVLAGGTTATEGATTGASTTGDGSESAATEAGVGPQVGTLALVAAGTIVGVVLGAGAVWITGRRRNEDAGGHLHSQA